MELVLPERLRARLELLYGQMEEAYAAVARKLAFSCEGCPDNCCDSYFQHHTYVEWVYLREGLAALPVDRRREIERHAAEYLQAVAAAESRGERPQVMCPLNEGGLCILYQHRMLVCRTHGVPARMRRPDGQILQFPGCFRCQELVEEREKAGAEIDAVERTPLLLQLVDIENELLHFRRHVYPKVKLTIADMIVKGPPAVTSAHCEP